MSIRKFEVWTYKKTTCSTCKGKIPKNEVATIVYEGSDLILIECCDCFLKRKEPYSVVYDAFLIRREEQRRKKKNKRGGEMKPYTDKNCECHKIVKEIDRRFSDSDWNCGGNACNEWNVFSKNLKDNNIEFENEDDEYSCTCPTCGDGKCGACV